MFNTKVQQHFKRKAGSGIDAPANTQSGNNLLHTAVNDLDPKKVLDLIEKGANVNQPNFDGNTALHLAIAKKDHDLINLLLDKGADVNVKNGAEESCFFNAVHKEIKNSTLVKMMDMGADISASNKQEKTVLHSASEQGNAKLVSILVNKGADVNAKTATGMAPVHFAANKGNIDSVNILADNSANLDIKNNALETPLHLASKENHIEVVRFLLTDNEVQKNINKNVNMRDGENAAAYAVKKNNAEIVELLLEYGVEPNRQDNNGRQLLYHAAMKGHLEISSILIEKGADVRKATVDKKTEKTLMHHAVKNNNVKLVALLYKHNADVDIVDESDNTPLSEAIEFSKDYRIVTALLAAGADVNRMDSLGNRPIDKICSNYFLGENRQKILSSVLSKRPNLKMSDDLLVDTPPLHMLIEKGHMEAIPQLIDAGADIHETDRVANHTTFLSSCVKGNIDIWEMLFNSDNPPNVGDVDFEGKNAIQIFSDTNDHLTSAKDKLKYLIEKGVDIEHRDNNGMTPILSAAKNNHENCFNIMAISGADLTKVDNDGNNVIHNAMHAMSQSIHKKALEYVDILGINTLNNEGMNALHLASRVNRPKAVEALLEVENIDIEMENGEGKTALELAVRGGNVGVINKLIEKGANKDLRFEGGQSLMHLAATLFNKNTIAKLHEVGMDINEKDANGNTALHIASELGKHNVVEYLLNNGAIDSEPNNNGKVPFQIALEGTQNLSIKKFMEFHENKAEILKKLEQEKRTRKNQPKM